MVTKRHSRTSRLITVAVLVLLTFLFSGCATRSSYSPAAAPIFDKLIVPGKRIGPIALGMPQADVLKTLGPPQSSTIRAEKGMFSTYVYGDLTVGICSDSNSVRIISTRSPEYATADGIHVGMTEPEVRVKRGKPKRVFQHDALLKYWYGSSLDIEIHFDPKNGYRIDYIQIDNFK